MITEITSLLKAKFNGNKDKTMLFLNTHGITHWTSFCADPDAQLLVLKILKDTREWITLNINGYSITRPKHPKNISEISWSIDGIKL